MASQEGVVSQDRALGRIYDLTVEQFVQGYIEIVLPMIPQGPATQIARDHICYLQHMMRDTSSAPWHLFRSTHKQILLMVEHKQLKWENAAARDAIRAAQLLIAKEEAIQEKFFDLPAKSTKPGNKPQPKEELKPCHSYNNGTCTHLKNHVIDGTRMLHVCAHCFRHSNHHHRHQESACTKKWGKAWNHHQGKETHRLVRSRSPPSTSPLSLPSSSQPAPPAARLDATSFQPLDFPQPDRRVDDFLLPTDLPHHSPVAATSDSHLSGLPVQDPLLPPGHFKTKEEKEDHHVDDTLLPTDRTHHIPVAAPTDSHTSGNLAQDLF